MSLETRHLSPGDGAALADLFAALVAAGDERHFHPHPLTAEHARDLCDSYRGQDVYMVVEDEGRFVAYGMLRGWDEGYEVPSLGIAVHPDARGRGVSRVLMSALHDAAAAHGARRVRLRVYPDNASAVALYRSLGYQLAGEPDGGEQLIGHVDLPEPSA
ncbi:MAG: hypothetical protein QOE92_719 [Chloroflexota bacterium]|nr:hypothetical protein [Chloroflexota bacterium]